MIISKSYLYCVFLSLFYGIFSHFYGILSYFCGILLIFDKKKTFLNNKKRRKRIRPSCHAIICNRRKSCNFPSIFCSVFPSRNTFHPNNPVPSPRRNRGKPLCRCIRGQALRISCRNPCIYTVKKAYSFSKTGFSSLLYSVKTGLASVFHFFCPTFFLFSTAPYKIAFPSKKLSKNPATSTPTRSKHPTKSPTPAI